MATTSDLSRGLFIRFNGQLCVVVEYQHTMPGKGGAFYQVKMKNAIDELKNTTIIEQALKTGDALPQIELPNATGTLVNVNEILSQGKKLVIAFYRGGWCPYCNLELKALQNILPQLEVPL